ncbi:hypothetical protein MSAN_01358200 [Mycena sanguinolenta]|uniref:F-box domain-containing protein n=1 Tax=Mycena sanguinolenta TaxID=230812 RepID=A0A8H6YAV1_9AGAR|nr:hypothetical protein MSAN_01358200 [Mycena sanguinolenta]
MTLTPASVRSAVLEQIERTRHCSKADIERFIEESESRIISLDSQIDPLIELRDSKRARILAPDAQLNALVELRDSQRACVLALRYITSPVCTLPVELLSEIFKLSIEDGTHIQDAHRISQVCAHWRRVAHSTPRLWTRPLTVDLCKGKTVADGLKTWMLRSFPLPISISFMPLRMCEDINPAIVEEVLKVAPRSSSLLFPIMYLTPFSFVMQLAQRRLDSLEEMELGRIDKTDHSPLTFTAPRLRKFSMADPRPWQIIVPWTQLTDLVFHSHSHKDTFGILAQCTNLLRMSMTTVAWHRFPEAEPDNLVLGRLRTLILHFMEESGAITPFFDFISAPCLRILRLCVDQEQPWTPASFTTFQLRAPNITRLEFTRSNSLTSDDVVAVMIHAPSLTHLKISYCAECFDDVFVRTLYYKDGVKPLVPRLHNLFVRQWYHMVNFTETVLAGMIASRWRSDAELASDAAPPAVARWTHVEIDMRAHEWGSKFMEILRDVPPNVLVY